MRRSNRDDLMARLVEVLDAAHSVVITGHVGPDGDVIGSEIALASGLRALGKHVVVVNDVELPRHFRFLRGTVPVVEFGHDAAGEIERADVVCVVDNAQWSRLGPMEEAVRTSSARVVCIDHHLHDEPFSELHLYDLDAASTGELVFDLLAALGVSCTLEIALAVYVTLCTDTGWFRHSNTTPRSMRLAADLIEMGIDPSEVYVALRHRSSPKKKRALARFLKTIRVEAGGVLAWGNVKRVGRSDTNGAESFVEHVRDLEGVGIAAVLVELDSNATKVSLRTRPPYSARALASELGGGGHEHAAGAVVDGAPGRVVDRFRRLAHRQIEAARDRAPGAGQGPS